jgi:UDP-N-acetylglucosamine 4-epimerase
LATVDGSKLSLFKELSKILKTKQKTWLLTGNAGFIGSNIMEFLLNHNQKVVGIDNFSTGFQHNIDDVLSKLTKNQVSNFTFIEGDISNLSVCVEACNGIDIVLHQASLGSVPRSIEDPINSNNSNVTGFLNMLTASKDAGIKRFVYASSSSVYGDSKELPKIEERTGNLLSPYAVTKATNELYAKVFKETYGMETIGLRYFNVFGRRQDPNGAYAAVVPKWIGSLLNDEAVYINGDGKSSRDFTYIDNVIQMNILAGLTNNSKAFGEPFNVAVGGRDSLNELYDLLNEELSSNIEKFHKKEAIYRDFRVGDIRHSNADISKAKDYLGYEPTHNIYSGMKEAIVWYIENEKTELQSK